jgi:hypothetical protein
VFLKVTAVLPVVRHLESSLKALAQVAPNLLDHSLVRLRSMQHSGGLTRDCLSRVSGGLQEAVACKDYRKIFAARRPLLGLNDEKVAVERMQRRLYGRRLAGHEFGDDGRILLHCAARDVND